MKVSRIVPTMVFVLHPISWDTTYRKDERLYPLRSKIFCGSCFHAMARYGKKNCHFVCTHSQADENAHCHGLSVKESELESVVYTVLKKQAQIILGAVDMDSSCNMNLLTAKHTEFYQRITEMQEQKHTLFEQMILHEIGEQEYKTQKAGLDVELARLQEVQTTLSTQLSQRQADEQTKKANKELAQKVVDVGKLSSELVDAAIECIYVYPDRNIEIAWKVAGFSSDEKKYQKNY